jgi:PAS domain S-box-containing protein
MLNFLQELFLSRDYIPHGHCYLWQTPLVGLHITSNALIAIAYFSIPAMLVYFLYQRKDIPFSQVFALFGAFIVLCGISHLIDIWTLWYPFYWISGIERALTALVSCYTALQLVELLPQFLALRSPQELEILNQKLEEEILERKRAEAMLEVRVQERTAELIQANLALSAEIAERKAIQVQLQEITAREKATLLEKAHLASFHLEINTAVTASQSLKSILKYCTDIVVNYLDAAFARIWMLNIEENVLELQASSGMYTHLDGPHGRIAVGKYKIGLIAQNQQSHLTNNVLEDPCVSDKEWAKREGMVAFAGYPLILDNCLIGVIAIFARRTLTESYLEALRLATNQIALGIKRIEAEQKLKESEEKYRYLIETSHNIIWSVDANRCWSFVNQAVKDIYGYEPEEMIGRYIDNFFPTERENVGCSLLPSRVSQDSLIQYETIILSKDGRELNLLSNAIILQDEEGNFKGATGTSTNITELKQAYKRLEDTIEELQVIQEQLRSQNEELELARENLATAMDDLQRTQTQLIQQEKMSSLGQLVAGVAHEINNPVNFIYGNLNHAVEYTNNLLMSVELCQQRCAVNEPEILELLEEIEFDYLKEDLPKLLNSMRIGAERIREIVLSLRVFSRLDEAEVKKVNIHEGINSTLLLLQSQLNETKKRPRIEVIKEYGELPLVKCYAGQLNQVFMNLLANAIDAIDEAFTDGKISNKKPQIRICTQVILESNQVIIRFIDNGIGITEVVKAQLFDPFFTTKPIGKGTGMGLAISYQIITERHGGSLQCFSELGQGSEFVITIPLYIDIAN